MHREAAPENDLGVTAAGEGNFPGASSGDISGSGAEEFPELVAAVAQAIALPSGATLPASLRGAIARFPERVLEAIAYLNYQRQRRHIRNPVGYLYEAIVGGWELHVPEASELILPTEFRQWFDEARTKGDVLAAMMINGIHHTLHVDKGWVPTELIICDNSR